VDIAARIQGRIHLRPLDVAKASLEDGWRHSLAE